MRIPERIWRKRKPDIIKPPDFLSMDCPKCGQVTWHIWISVNYGQDPPIAVFRCIVCGEPYASKWEGRKWSIR